MNNNDFFKKDPFKEKDKKKNEDSNIDDSILDSNEIDSGVPENDIDDILKGGRVEDSDIESIIEKEEIETIESQLKDEIEPETETAPEKESESDITIEPVLLPETKAVEDFNSENKGEILKRERLKKGLSLELVHEVTKVPMDVLRAIEEGYKVRNLSPFYLKGFLKIYAQYLEVDVSRVVGVSRKEKLPAHVKFEDDQLDINRWLSSIFTRKRKQQIVIGLGILLALFLVFKIASFSANFKSGKKTVKVSDAKNDKKKITVRKPKAIEKKKNATKKDDKKEVEAVAKKKADEIAQKKASETQVPKKKIEVKQVIRSTKLSPAVTPPQNAVTKVISSSTTDVATKKNVSLTVRAKKNSWLSVKVDGKVVFQSTLRLGSVETWLADESIEISGKNINQLDFELNGKMIRSLGRKDRKAKRLIVTKEGLTVTN